MTTRATIDLDTDVLVIGAGPVGLVLACQLAHAGVSCVLAERGLGPTEYPKMDITNARSMELLRRLDLADAVRAVGVAPAYSFDVIFSTGLDRRELARWELPSVDRARSAIEASNDGTMPREPAQRCAQSLFESLVRDRCEADPLVDVRSGWRCDDLVQDGDAVDATFTDTVAGEARRVRARWVVGCDGAASVTRRSVGIGLSGAAGVASMAMIHFRSHDLAHLHRFGRFWHIYFTNGGVIISQDEVDTWTVHQLVRPDFSWEGTDPVAFLRETLGTDVEVDDVLLTSTWQPNLLVADHYRHGRVFLAGDSAHQVIPTGGYGMNTGVGDAVDIGWKLAAVVNGWGGPALLDSYEAERRPVAEANRDRSARHAFVLVDWRHRIDHDLVDADGPDAEAHRGELAAFLIESRGENESFGIELDYRLRESPVIVPDGTPEPPWDPMVVNPSARPGHRLPHVRSIDDRGGGADGAAVAVHDLLGTGFTLLLLDPAVDDDAERIVVAARTSAVPLQLVRLDDEHVRSVYGSPLVLVRPDGFVAWRGSDAPSDPKALLDTVRGAAM